MDDEIIDVHTHIGKCNVFDLFSSSAELLESQRANHVSRTIIQPFPGAPDPKKVHDEIANLSKELPGQVYGIVSLNPHIDHDTWISETERLVRDEGFVGIKIHTIGHAVNPLGNDALMVFETAKRLGVPVMIHTGPGIPFSLPSLVLPRARQFPDIPIVLAHAGWGILVGEAIVASSLEKNLFVEPSHVAVVDKLGLLANLGADRILLGSDLPSNLSNEINQIKSISDSDKSMKKMLGGNAKRIFKLS